MSDFLEAMAVVISAIFVVMLMAVVLFGAALVIGAGVHAGWAT